MELIFDARTQNEFGRIFTKTHSLPSEPRLDDDNEDDVAEDEELAGMVTQTRIRCVTVEPSAFTTANAQILPRVSKTSIELLEWDWDSNNNELATGVSGFTS